MLYATMTFFFQGINWKASN